MDKVNLYILHTSLVKDNYEFVLSFVDEQRKETALKYAHEKDRLLSLGAGYLLKKHLPNKEIKKTSSGKPFIEGGPQFNISHSGEYVVLAIHPSRPVGVDIERIDDKKLDAIKYVLNDEEKGINEVHDLFRIWSNKESLIKCTSIGLKDIRKVKGLPLERVREGYYTKSMIYDGYSLSITLKDEEPFELSLFKISTII